MPSFSVNGVCVLSGADGVAGTIHFNQPVRTAAPAKRRWPNTQPCCRPSERPRERERERARERERGGGEEDRDSLPWSPSR